MTQTATATRTTRYFGKCPVQGCKHRVVVELTNAQASRTLNEKHECVNGHRTYLRWDSLNGKYSAKHECGSRCMASTGPSCSCTCGGANHGTAHL